MVPDGWRWVMAVVLFLGGVAAGDPLVRWVLGAGALGAAGDFDRQASRWIGLAERTLIVLLAVPAGLEAIPWVLAAKSVARWPSLEGGSLRPELYIVGTLVSVIVATAATLLVRLALGLPLATAR
jgi:hypothetical protein